MSNLLKLANYLVKKANDEEIEHLIQRARLALIVLKDPKEVAKHLESKGVPPDTALLASIAAGILYYPARKSPRVHTGEGRWEVGSIDPTGLSEDAKELVLTVDDAIDLRDQRTEEGFNSYFDNLDDSWGTDY